MSNLKLGRKAETKNMPKVKPNLGIKNIRLDAKHPFPEQLRAFRELLGIPQAFVDSCDCYCGNPKPDATDVSMCGNCGMNLD